MKREYFQYISTLILTFAGFVAVLLNPQQASTSVNEAVELCISIVIPAIFPFLVFSSLIVSLGFAEPLGQIFKGIMRPLFNVPPGCSIAMILGFISGFPIGANTAVNLYQKGVCTKTEAERLLTFSNNPSFSFVLSTIGVGIWANKNIGWFLWLIQTISVIIIGNVYGTRWGTKSKEKVFIKPDLEKNELKQKVFFSKAFTDAIKKGGLGILNICSFIIFFTIIIKLLLSSALYNSVISYFSETFPSLESIAKPLFSGFFEMTTGVNSINTESNFIEGMTVTATVLGWSGLSVHCQVLSFIYEGGLSPKPYIVSKILQTLLASLLTFLLTVILF